MRQRGGSHRKKERERNGKGLLFVGFLAAFFFSAILGYAYAAEHNFGAGAVSASAPETGAVEILENCNIREAPGTASAVIGGGKAGEIFEYAGSTEATGENSLWYSIDMGDGVGWVSEAVAAFRPDS